MRFTNFLCKETELGLRAFKKSSKINKDWIKMLEINNLRVLDRPWLGFYFENCYGRHSTRLFSINNTVYCSLSLKDNDYDFPVPKGMIEIRASEFFKIIEDNVN